MTTIEELIERGESDYSFFKGYNLKRAAIFILLTPDVHEKARLTFALSKAFTLGIVDIGESDVLDTICPARPHRPSNVQLVHPLKVKSSTRRHMLHSLCHAESFAIDLSWDIIARFGWSPELWYNLPLSFTTTELQILPTSSSSRMPDEFFQMWIKVASEEAKHFTKWTLRLQSYNNTFYGDLPAHEGLWQSAVDTSHSLLARLCIVHCIHEARGLDVYPLMRSKLGDDIESVAVLDANRDEEITHVEAGRIWLETLSKNAKLDPIDMFKKCSRAYFFGSLRPPFATESRNKAGLTEDFYLDLSEPRLAEDVPYLGTEDMG
jgi:uncharacterized ferritin-like protein (DUF455 family)